jgi:exonuclease III
MDFGGTSTNNGYWGHGLKNSDQDCILPNKKTSFIIIVHHNVSSYRNKFHGIFEYISEKKVDIFCLSETWLSDGLSVCIPPGYTMIRNDRPTHWGGVAILYKDSFKISHEVIDKTDWRIPNTIELLCCSFQLHFNKSIIVCVIYRTNTVANDIYNIDLLLSYLMSRKKTFYVLGDFNINL